jgi:polyisoprenyl-teichoic acid--peptidoglycan teichoic acid transferase
VAPGQQPPRVAWAMWKRFLLGAFVIVAMTATATATAGLLEVRDVVNALEQGEELDVAGEITRAEAGEAQTIMLLGSDKRFGDEEIGREPRSDTIILVRLDPDRDETAMMSLPRDLIVDIELEDGRTVRDRINYAYEAGGPKLTVKTVKDLLGTEEEPFQVNHVLNVNFGGFQRAVNRIGCVYVDVDRRYFNDNSDPNDQYATIDVPPGYQRLCGSDSLDFVRYRHEDNDIVRGLRQQEFLRQTKEQVGVQRLLGDRKALTRILGRYTQTDRSLRSTSALLQLLKLGVYLSDNPVRDVDFPAKLGNDPYVRASQRDIERMVREFMGVRSSTGPRAEIRETDEQRRSEQQRPRKPATAGGLEDAAREGEEQALAIEDRTPFPVLYPKLRHRRSVYAGERPRAYPLRDPGGNLHRAYRMVLQKGAAGEYYGVQGMTWKDPPILRNPSETRRIGNRSFDLFYDGDRVRMVAWRTDEAVYWVSNTLLRSLSERQMLAIAGSLQAPGGR